VEQAVAAVQVVRLTLDSSLAAVAVAMAVTHIQLFL
jgi:hypothetical protein